MKTLLVGMSPGRRGDGEPLSGQIGRRLSRLCDLTLEQYLDRFERINLIPHHVDRWPASEAREAANELLVHQFRNGRRIVLLGRAVAAAFRQPALVPFQWHGDAINHGFRVAMCPHPSGRCRWWNDPANVRLARAFWRGLVAAA